MRRPPIGAPRPGSTGDAGASPSLPVPSLPPLGPAIHGVGRDGFALVPGALSASWRQRMLREVAGEPFWTMPETVGRTRQRAQQLIVHGNDDARPVTSAVSGALADAVRQAAPPDAGLARFAPSHAMYLRYSGAEDGMGPHRDAMTYVLLVGVLTLLGAARFSVLSGPGRDPEASWTTAPGDLCLLRAPGFAGAPDGRPWHCVDGPDGEERVAVVFRMTGRPPAAGGTARS